MSKDQYRVGDNPAEFDLERAFGWIARESYWGAGIPFDVFARAVANSMNVGVFASDGAMVAMARVVTDRATFAWIADVFVDEAHRGRGLGKRLMAFLDAHADLQGLRRRVLATRDAHGLYAQFGFSPLARPDSWMEVLGPDLYQR